jgi:hypothetical protein
MAESRFSAAELIFFLPAPAPKSGQKLTIPARAETEDVRLRKDQLEVLRKTHKPFAKRCPRIQSPVAEANSS